MRIIEKGHIYELHNKQGGSQILEFFKDLPETEDGHNGVLCQEVIRALIDRVWELTKQVPCNESIEIIEHLRACLILFEARAARRALEKCYAKTGKHIEELEIGQNGHVLFFKPE